MSKCIICDLEVEKCDCGKNQLVATDISTEFFVEEEDGTEEEKRKLGQSLYEDIILSPAPVCSICGGDLMLGNCFNCDRP